MTFKDKLALATTWQSKIHIINLYHALMIIQESKWTIRRTAKYFGVSVGKVSEDLKLSDRFDEVSECTSRQQALNKIRKVRTTCA